MGVLIGFAAVAILTFEIARLYKVYDYKSMIKELIGPLWPLFDVVYVLTMIVIIAVMASASGDIVESTTGLNYWTGIIYVAYNLCIFPSSMFSLKRQESRKECVISDLMAGVLMTAPWFMTYFALLCFYPNADVLSANIPWLVMINSIGAPEVFSIIFGIVMGWTLIETSTGVIHALLGRVNVELKEKKKNELDRKQQAAITVVILVTACVLSKFGIIDLIEKGYSLLSYGFMILYLLPILTIGLYKVLKKEPILKADMATTILEEKGI